MKNKKLSFFVCVAIPLLVGGLSALVSSKAMENYKGLVQPPLAPPGWIFPVVWTILFVLMGIASFLVLKQGPDRDEVANALKVYGVQLVFNFVWSILFFNLGLYYLAFGWLVMLWVLILVTILQFNSISKAAARLMVPYLLWVTFAGYLNLAIAILN